MPSIESLGYPLVFKMRDNPPAKDRTSAVRIYGRALEGMQKEAIVCVSTESGQRTWRMVSDEGPYLNGTDLAPFPLAFYTAGMQFSMLSEVARHARERHVELTSLRLRQDNYYTMEGSALQGTMIGGAKPAELHIEIESDASAEIIARLVHLAEQSSPAHAIMRDVLSNTFALTFNGHKLPLVDLNPSAGQVMKDLEPVFAVAQPDDAIPLREDIITKVSSAKKTFGVEGGAGSSLQAEQKRTLHIHGEARVVDGLLMETTIQLYKPIGSTFHFICDETRDAGGEEIAPPPLAYLSAGIGFCYMTQLGRYAHITKQDLKSYQIVQDTVFETHNRDGMLIGQTHPVDTHVILEANENDEMAQNTVRMGERTCFLHAAMRGSVPSSITLTLNGESLLAPK